MKIYETENTFAFMDIAPISPYHSLIIPKYHAAKLHEMPDEYLSELLPIAKKIAKAMGVSEYNILQNNGKGAHQAVDHVHGGSHQPL
jgi:diadenosine tetraphosphate (Ap4A) HIT family hydrolase